MAARAPGSPDGAHPGAPIAGITLVIGADGDGEEVVGYDPRLDNLSHHKGRRPLQVQARAGVKVVLPGMNYMVALALVERARDQGLRFKYMEEASRTLVIAADINKAASWPN